MAMKWTEVRVGDLGQVFTGRTPSTFYPEYFGEVFHFVTPGDMHHRKYAYSTERRLSTSGADLLRRIQLPPRSICVSCIGWQMGEVVMTTATSFTNQQINSIVPNCNVDPDFIYYSFVPRKQELLSLASAIGVRTPILNKSFFCDLRLMLPPLPTQRKIAAILSAYDDLIENNLRRIKILEEMAQTLYREWFVKFRFPGHEQARFVDSALGKIPEGWEVRKVGEILQKVKRGTKIQKQDYSLEGIIPVIDQGKEFVGGFTDDLETLISDDLPIIVFGDHTRILKYIDFPFACGADGTQLLKSNEDRMPSSLFYYALSAIDLSNFAYARHFKFLKEETVYLPEQSIADYFDHFVLPLRDQIRVFLQKNATLRRTRDLLLPKLISGEVDVSELDISIPEEVVP
jgi:type I restriction enzyme S subunit